MVAAATLAAGVTPPTESGAAVLPDAGPGTAGVVDPECPPTWEWPPIHSDDPSYTDYNISVFVGGDFRVEGSSAEAEGRVWVAGQTLIDRQPPSLFNLGRIGAGSQVAPPPGSTMLLTGTTTSEHLTVTDGNLLDVGHGLDGGGDVQVAGDVVPNISRVETNGGGVSYRMGAEATSRYASFGDDLRGLSNYLDGQFPNGTVSVDGNRLHFTGTGEPGVLQVFEIDAAVLGRPTVELYFRDIPDETAVVINVRGATASLNPVWTQDENERADYFGSPRFAKVAVRTLWNFTDATSLGLLGTGQILGSILAMDADQTLVSASTNGRLHVGGDLILDGVGNELHNYHWPWSKITECTSVPEVPEARPMGRVAVAKLMYGDYSTMRSVSQQSFVGTAQCPSDQELGAPARGFRWRAMPGQVSENNSMTIGQQCTVVEMEPEAPPGEGLAWGDPIMDPADGTIVVTEDAQQVDVYINNLLVGPFHVRKKVVGPEGNDTGFVGDRHFDIDYTCTLAGAPTDGFDAAGERVPGSASGRIQIRNGETVRSLDFAMGTVCRLSENLTSIDGEFEDGYQWSGISLAPSETVTIQAGTVGERTITVTNSFERSPLELGQFSVRKEVRTTDGGDVDSSRTFTADYRCTLEGKPSIGYDPESPGSVVAPHGTGRLTLSDGQSTASPAFRVGTLCILSESGEDDTPDDGYRWSGLEFTPSDHVVIGPGDPTDNSVTAINTLTPIGTPMASFSVLKRVEGPGGGTDGFQNPDRAFTVDYGCTVDGGPSMGYAPDRQTVVAPTGTGRLDLRASGPAVQAPWFVTGTICDLSEDNPAYGNDFIDAGHAWDQAVFTPGSTVRLEEPDAVTAVTLTNIFSVTEIEPAPLRERFALTKTVDGPAGDIVNPDRLFRIGYACTFEGAPATGYDADGEIVSDGTGILTLKAGQTVDGPFFEVGTTCTFTEEQTGGDEDFPGHEGEFQWSEVTFNRPMPITIRHQEDHPVEIVANNRFEAVTIFGTFTLTKRIEGPDPEALTDDLSFAVDFTCTRDGLPAVGYDPGDPTTIVSPDGTGTLTLPGDGSVVPGPRFRTGTTCELREEPGNRDDDFTLPGYQWSDAVFTPGSTFTLDRDASEPISITLTNHFGNTEAPSGPETPVDPTLPVTGSDGPILILLAAALVAGGIALLSRRRSTAPSGRGDEGR